MFWTTLEILRIIIHLDPAFFLSAPALAWDSMMLDLITDKEWVIIHQRMRRGGLAFVGSKRHVFANNKYIPNYNQTDHQN